jgi:hypothetical protein
MVGSTSVLLADNNGDINRSCIERHNFAQIKFVSALKEMFSSGVTTADT